MAKAGKTTRCVSIVIPDHLHILLTARAKKAGLSISKYAEALILADAKEVAEFHAHHAARHAYASFVLLTRIIDLIEHDKSKIDQLYDGIKQQSHGFYGPLPKIPMAVEASTDWADNDWLTNLRDSYRRELD